MTATCHHRGCHLAYEIQGNGPPVLFIQGVGVHGAGWKPQIDELSRHFTCLSFDNRGLGRSQPDAGGFSVTDLADDARALLDAVGWESAHIVGHSLGGLIAQRLALDHRQRVKSLSLLCTFADGRSVAPVTWKMAWLGLRMKFGTHRMRRDAFLQFILPPDGSPWHGLDWPTYFGHDLVNLPPIAAHQLRALRRENVLPRLSELKALPTLVLSATHDPLAPPRLSEAIANAMGATHKVYRDASHGLPITHVNDVNEMMKQLFDNSDV